MIKRIHIKELAPGMRIVDSGINWLDNPYLYSDNAMATAELIAGILDEGYQEVFIDTGYGRAASSASAQGLGAELEAEFGAALGDSEPPVDYASISTSLAAEMPAAKAIYTDAIYISHAYMDGIRRGDNVDPHMAESLVDSVLGSLARNPDALLGLCKLRDADAYTYTHSVNVAVLSTMFARYMGYPHKVQHAVGMTGIFHDLGKAMVPIELIQAPRRLTADEFAILCEHPRLGYEQVKKISGFAQDIMLGIHDHHERSNGSGYPRGLYGDGISLLGRIVAVADVYDALSSRRPYKKAILTHKVLGIMYQMRNEDFHPGFMEHFIRMLGVYPVGSIVQIENGNIGVVSASTPGKPVKPKVLVLQNSSHELVRPHEIDTSEAGALKVVRCLQEGESSIDPGKALNMR